MAANDAVLSGVTVLIIEDEFLIAADLQRIVEGAGAGPVLLASSTAAAHGFLDGDRPIDLGILDLKLGSEDGIPLARELRDRGIPFIVVTGLDHTIDFPDVDVVQKPYADREIAEALVKARAAGRKP